MSTRTIPENGSIDQSSRRVFFKHKCCPISANLETRLTEVAFINLCKVNQRRVYSSWGHNAEGSLRETCVGCDTGAKILRGADFDPPEHVTFLKIEDLNAERE